MSRPRPRIRLSRRPPLSPWALPLVLAAFALGRPGVAVGDAATNDPGSGQPFLVPVGDARLDIDDADVDRKMGGAFVLGLRSGANNCYVEALLANPRQKGEIDFVVTPPRGDGKYDVTLRPKGLLDTSLVDCVRGLFGDFYHYADKLSFEHLPGTLRFEPKLIPAPPPPSDAALRAALDTWYAKAGIVRIVKVTLADLSHDVDRGSSEIFRRYRFDVDLEFASDGYEATCRHYDVYKVFARQPHKTPYAGHTCENAPRKAGERTVDHVELDASLVYWPEVATSWELRGSGVTGTRPGGE